MQHQIKCGYEVSRMLLLENLERVSTPPAWLQSAHRPRLCIVAIQAEPCGFDMQAHITAYVTYLHWIRESVSTLRAWFQPVHRST